MPHRERVDDDNGGTFGQGTKWVKGGTYTNRMRRGDPARAEEPAEEEAARALREAAWSTSATALSESRQGYFAPKNRPFRPRGGMADVFELQTCSDSKRMASAQRKLRERRALAAKQSGAAGVIARMP